MNKLVQRHRSWRTRLVLAVTGLVLGIGLWYAYTTYQSGAPTPDNLPTAEEWERIRAVEEAGSQFAPNATPGVGVVPAGSKPRTPVAEEEDSLVEESATSIPPIKIETEEEAREETDIDEMEV